LFELLLYVQWSKSMYVCVIIVLYVHNMCTNNTVTRYSCKLHSWIIRSIRTILFYLTWYKILFRSLSRYCRSLRASCLLNTPRFILYLNVNTKLNRWSTKGTRGLWLTVRTNCGNNTYISNAVLMHRYSDTIFSVCNIFYDKSTHTYLHSFYENYRLI